MTDVSGPATVGAVDGAASKSPGGDAPSPLTPASASPEIATDDLALREHADAIRDLCKLKRPQ
jgi:hypothetical protein